MINLRKLYQTIGSPFYSLMYNKSKQSLAKGCFFSLSHIFPSKTIFFLLCLYLGNVNFLAGQTDEFQQKAEKMLFLNQIDSLKAYVDRTQLEYRNQGNWEDYINAAVPLVRIDIEKLWYELPQTYYEDLIEVMEKHNLKDGSAAAKIYEGFARLNMEKEDFESAASYFQLAEKLSDQYYSDKSLERAGFYISKAFFCSELSEISRGKAVCDKAIQILADYYNDSTSYSIEKSNYVKLLLSHAFITKSILTALGGNYKEAESLNNFSLKLRNQLTHIDASDYADNYNIQGIVFEARGDYATGIEYLENALNVYEKPPFQYTKEHAMVLNHLGIVYQEYASYPQYINIQKVVDYHTEALGIHRRLDYKKGMALSMVYIANAYLALGQQDSFQHYYSLLSDFIPANLTDNPQVMAEYYGYNGIRSVLTGNFPEGLDYFKKQYEVISSYGDSLSTNKVIVLRSLGYTTLHLGRHNDALDLFYEGCELLGVKREVLEEYQLPEMNSVSSINELSFMIENIANVYKLWTDAKPDSIPLLKTSLRSHELAVNMLDSLRARIFGDEMRSLFPEIYYHVYSNGIAVAHRLYLETGEEQYIERAWEIMEKGKASQLISGIRSSVLSNEDGLVKQEVDFRSEIARISLEIALNQELGLEQEVKALTSELIRLREKQNQFITKINRESPGYLSRFFNPSVISMQDFRKVALKDNEVFVNYFMSGTLLTIIAISKEKAVFKEVPLSFQNADNLNMLIDYFPTVPDLDNPEDIDIQQNYLRAAHEIYQKMIIPFMDIADGKDLIISPLSGFYRIPFEALLTEPIDNRGALIDYRELPYLLHKYPIQYAFSANTYAYEKSGGPLVKGGRVLGMAPVDFSHYRNKSEENKEVIDLDDSQTEIEKIAAIYPLAAFYFDLATEETFEKKANNYSIIHLATHGLMDTTNILLPRMLFYGAGGAPEGGRDNILYLSEIYGKSLNADLVVLSACYSGEGKRQIGEGVMSLGRGFRYTGAKSVLMSIWQVTDNIAPKFMERFYKLMAKGKSKRIALHEAKKAFLKEESNRNMPPFFWSTFVLYGDPVSIEPASQTNPWMVIGLIVVLLGIVGLWVKRRK